MTTPTSTTADATASGPYETLQVLVFVVALALVTSAAGLLLGSLVGSGLVVFAA